MVTTSTTTYRENQNSQQNHSSLYITNVLFNRGLILLLSDSINVYSKGSIKSIRASFT